MKEVNERQRLGHGVRVVWVKPHVGIPGNERANKQAKFFTSVLYCICCPYFFTSVIRPEVLTEGGIKQQLTAQRKKERAQVGWGKGRVARWGRRAATKYTHCRTGKGNLRGWLREIGKECCPLLVYFLGS